MAKEIFICHYLQRVIKHTVHGATGGTSRSLGCIYHQMASTKNAALGFLWIGSSFTRIVR